jgi:hypothetical protein
MKSLNHIYLSVIRSDLILSFGLWVRCCCLLSSCLRDYGACRALFKIKQSFETLSERGFHLSVADHVSCGRECIASCCLCPRKDPAGPCAAVSRLGWTVLSLSLQAPSVRRTGCGGTCVLTAPRSSGSPVTLCVTSASTRTRNPSSVRSVFGPLLWRALWQLTSKPTLASRPSSASAAWRASPPQGASRCTSACTQVRRLGVGEGCWSVSLPPSLPPSLLSPFFLAQVGFHGEILLPQPPECWNYRCASSHLLRFSFF